MASKSSVDFRRLDHLESLASDSRLLHLETGESTDHIVPDYERNFFAGREEHSYLSLEEYQEYSRNYVVTSSEYDRQVKMTPPETQEHFDLIHRASEWEREYSKLPDRYGNGREEIKPFLRSPHRVIKEYRETATIVEPLMKKWHSRLFDLHADLRDELNILEGGFVDEYNTLQCLREFVRLDPERRHNTLLPWSSLLSFGNQRTVGEEIRFLEFHLDLRPLHMWKKIIAFYLLNWQRSDDILRVIDDFLSDPSIDKEQCWEILDDRFKRAPAEWKRLIPQLDLDKGQRIRDDKRIPGDECWTPFIDKYYLLYEKNLDRISEETGSDIVCQVVDHVLLKRGRKTTWRDYGYSECEEHYRNSNGSRQELVGDLLRSAPQHSGPLATLYEKLISFVQEMNYQQFPKYRQWLEERKIIAPQFHTPLRDCNDEYKSRVFLREYQQFITERPNDPAERAKTVDRLNRLLSSIDLLHFDEHTWTSVFMSQPKCESKFGVFEEYDLFCLSNKVRSKAGTITKEKKILTKL